MSSIAWLYVVPSRCIGLQFFILRLYTYSLLSSYRKKGKKKREEKKKGREGRERVTQRMFQQDCVRSPQEQESYEIRIIDSSEIVPIWNQKSEIALGFSEMKLAFNAIDFDSYQARLLLSPSKHDSPLKHNSPPKHNFLELVRHIIYSDRYVISLCGVFLPAYAEF